MTTLSRWLAPAVLAAGLGFGAMTPAPVHAQDTLTRVLVNVADVIFNNGTPYYRYGDQGNDDRLVVRRDQYGRPVYYRQVPYGYNNSGYDPSAYNRSDYRTRANQYDRYGRRIYDQYGRRIDYANGYHDSQYSSPPYGNAYGFRGNARTKCNKHGKCKTHSYDARHDHDSDQDDDRDDRREHDDDD